MDKYIIKILREKCNIIQVFEKVNEGKIKLFWQFKLGKTKEPIIFKSFINNNQFAIMDWEGKLWVYDTVGKNEVLYKDFKSGIRSAGCMSNDNKYLYLSLEPENIRTLFIIDLNHLEVIDEIKLKNKISCYGLWQNNQGKLLFYYYDDDKISHGFITLDLKNKKEEKFKLSCPRQSYDHKMPWLDIKNGIGVRRYYNTEITKQGNEELFLSKVAVFDLTKFIDITIITAREYKAYQLGYNDNPKQEDKTAIELRTSLIENKPSDAVDEFIDDINSVWFTENGYFWICYRGGILRKIAIDGSRLSAYVVLRKIPHYSQSDPFMYKYFHTYIDYINEPKIILTDFHRFYRLTLPDIDIFTIKKPVMVDLEEYDPDENLITSIEEKKELKEYGFNIVNIKSIDDKESLLDALNQIEKLTRNIKIISNGNILAFLVKDGKNKLDEKKFFNKVIEYPQAKKIIKKIVDNFISYPDAKYLYYDDETTALAYAVESLVKNDPEYIESYMEYLLVMDMEHDVINREKIIPGLLKLYKGTDAEYRLRTSFLISEDDELCDIDFWKELNKKKAFYQWFVKEENRKNSMKWIAKCYQMDIWQGFDELIKMLEKKELSDLIPVLETALLNCSGIDDINLQKMYLNIGLRYFNLKEYKKAIKIYSKAIDLFPKNIEFFDKRGLSYIYLGEYKNAIADYTNAIKLKPDVSYYCNRGLCSLNLKDYAEALKDYEKALEYNPKHALSYYNQALCYYGLNDLEKAILSNSGAIKFNSDYSLAYNNRGVCYKDLKDYDNALKDFTKAIELDPKYAIAYNNRGECYEKTGLKDKADKDYQKAKEISKN